jgi:hypothetical protein
MGENGPIEMLVGAHRGFGGSFERHGACRIFALGSLLALCATKRSVLMERKKRQCKDFTDEFKNDAIKSSYCFVRSNESEPERFL